MRSRHRSAPAASAEWRRLVRARLAEMERILPGSGEVGAAFWNAPGRARRFDGAVGQAAPGDPLLAQLLAAVGEASTVLDIGAGTGRFSLALAPGVDRVVAVDPSRAMLAVLRRRARAAGITNVRTVEGRWQDVPLAPGPSGPSDGVPASDIVVCSYVLPLVPDAGAFLGRMDRICRGRAFLYLNALSGDALVDPLWRHFHRAPRRPAPTYLLAVAILRELGARPDLEVVELPVRTRFRDLAHAVRSYRETLLLPDTREARAELRQLLARWLQRDGDALRPPLTTTPAAIVSWTGALARGQRRPERAGSR